MDAAIDAPEGRTHAKFTGAVLRDLQVRVELETIRQPQPPDETSLYSAAMLQLDGLAANGDAVDLRQRRLRSAVRASAGPVGVRGLSQDRDAVLLQQLPGRNMRVRSDVAMGRRGRLPASDNPGSKKREEPKRREQEPESYPSAAGMRRRSIRSSTAGCAAGPSSQTPANGAELQGQSLKVEGWSRLGSPYAPCR